MIIFDENIERIIRTKQVGPFRIGQPFGMIGQYVPAPAYWHFEPGEGKSFYLAYGHLEIYLRQEEGVIRTYLIILKKYKFEKSFRFKALAGDFRLSVERGWQDPREASRRASAAGLDVSIEYFDAQPGEKSASIKIESCIDIYYFLDENMRQKMYSLEMH